MTHHFPILLTQDIINTYVEMTNGFENFESIDQINLDRLLSGGMASYNPHPLFSEGQTFYVPETFRGGTIFPGWTFSAWQEPEDNNALLIFHHPKTGHQFIISDHFVSALVACQRINHSYDAVVACANEIGEQETVGNLTIHYEKSENVQRLITDLSLCNNLRPFKVFDPNAFEALKAKSGHTLSGKDHQEIRGLMQKSATVANRMYAKSITKKRSLEAFLVPYDLFQTLLDNKDDYLSLRTKVGSAHGAILLKSLTKTYNLEELKQGIPATKEENSAIQIHRIPSLISNNTENICANHGTAAFSWATMFVQRDSTLTASFNKDYLGEDSGYAYCVKLPNEQVIFFDNKNHIIYGETDNSVEEFIHQPLNAEALHNKIGHAIIDHHLRPNGVGCTNVHE